VTELAGRVSGLIQEAQQRELHDADCFSQRRCGDEDCPHGPEQHVCDCTRGVRVAAPLAPAEAPDHNEAELRHLRSVVRQLAHALENATYGVRGAGEGDHERT
jgi:hypothetical protein